MDSFVTRFGRFIIGVLSGYDRVLFRGHAPGLSAPPLLTNTLEQLGIRLTDYAHFARERTKRIQDGVIAMAESMSRPTKYLRSPRERKEPIAREIAQADRVEEGLVCVLSCVEPCQTIKLVGRDEKFLASRSGKCRHDYVYIMDRVFGLMHVRLQTWVPFSVQIWINGREWLARQLDNVGVQYRRHRNKFTWIEDFEYAQFLMKDQLRTQWRHQLRRLTITANPVAAQLLDEANSEYYWTAEQTEWATDVAFRSRADLEAIYPALINHGLTTLGTDDAFRFLHDRPLSPRFEGEVITDLKRRPEGFRIKHAVGSNSLKLYDSCNLLRIETTIHNPGSMKVYRPVQGDPKGPKEWRSMRKGIADMHRRATLSQDANERYLEALADAPADKSVAALLQEVSKRVRKNRKNYRGLRLWSPDDFALLEAIGAGQHLINGFRNADIRDMLYSTNPRSDRERRSRGARVSRLFALLRAHGLIRKLPRSYRYQVTDKGRKVLSAVLRSKSESSKELQEAA